MTDSPLQPLDEYTVETPDQEHDYLLTRAYEYLLARLRYFQYVQLSC